MLRPARRSSTAIPIAAPRAFDLLFGISRSALRSLLLALIHCLHLLVEVGCHALQFRAQAHVLVRAPDRLAGGNTRMEFNIEYAIVIAAAMANCWDCNQRRGNQHADAERRRQRGTQQRRAGGRERPDCGLRRVVPPPRTLSVLPFEMAACQAAPRTSKSGMDQPTAMGRSP